MQTVGNIPVNFSYCFHSNALSTSWQHKLCLKLS